nr:hypothetical protein [uncultured Cohaesibacter sp.]
MALSAKIYNQIRNAVHQEWDPIGICSYSGELGEYDSYLPKLIELLGKGANEEQIFSFLWVAETEAMGLSGDEQATRKFSKWLAVLPVNAYGSK